MACGTILVPQVNPAHVSLRAICFQRQLYLCISGEANMESSKLPEHLLIKQGIKR